MADALTPRQEKELATTLRHLGRAMASLKRANIPDGGAGIYPDWLYDLRRAEEATWAASNKLVDALEEHDRRRASDE